ncbi:MAG: hypothetical protein GX361_00405 [Bacteroidales bacterium]|nr:hypothetical protein [Bacteroidales bacterium]
MEKDTQNIASAEQKSARSSYTNMDEWISRFRLAFSNGQLPHILPEMEKVGYTKERLDDYLAQTNALQAAAQQQKKEYGEQYAETEKFDTLRIKIAKLFRKHRALLKLFFKGNTQVYTLLRLNDEPTAAYSTWLQLVTNFYTQLKNDPELLAEASKVSVTEAAVDSALEQLETLRALKKSQRKELSEAQTATEVRDRAFDELYPHYRDFIEYAKIVLEDDQALEAIGVVVKR